MTITKLSTDATKTAVLHRIGFIELKSIRFCLH